jgi:hypothetical protein
VSWPSLASLYPQAWRSMSAYALMPSLAGTRIGLFLGDGGLAVRGAHTKVTGHGSHPRSGPNEITSPPPTADPYYRLSDQYYGYSDPYRGLYDFYAVPPYIPGYTYGHVKPGGWQ